MNSLKQKTLTWIFLFWFSVIILFAALDYLKFLPVGVITLLQVGLLVYSPLLLPKNLKSKDDGFNFNRLILKKTIIYFVGTLLCVLGFSALIWSLLNHFLGKSYFFYHHDYIKEFLNQFVVTAIPEEAFFRGFLLVKLSEIWPAKRRLFGMPWGLALLVTSVLFAVSHWFMHPELWYILTAFPAIIFAWLREKTGSIWASALFHASCNVFALWALASWR